MQDTLGNILSGLALQLDHSVTIGDWIDFDGVSGEVVQVQWRHTAVRTLFGEMILVPNSQLMKARVMLIGGRSVPQRLRNVLDRKSTRLNSSHVAISYAVFCYPPLRCPLMPYTTLFRSIRSPSATGLTLTVSAVRWCKCSGAIRPCVRCLAR